MKKTNAFLMLASVIGSISLASSAMAADPVETVELGVDFSISKCTNEGNGTSLCDAAASLPSNIAIELKTCSSSQGSTYCQGDWQSTITREGHSFTTNIHAGKWTYTAGATTTTSYSLSASVGASTESHESNSILINLNRGGSVSDSVYFYGPRLTIPGSNDSFTPSVLIAPKATPALN